VYNQKRKFIVPKKPKELPPTQTPLDVSQQVLEQVSEQTQNRKITDRDLGIWTTLLKEYRAMSDAPLT